MDLDKYIDQERLKQSGFNRFEELTLDSKGSYISCIAYLSHANHEVYKKEVNIVVIEAKRQHKNKIYTDFYIGSFDGITPTEIQEGGEIHDYLNDAKAIIARKNRVPKRDLGARILELLSKVSEDPVTN